MLLRRFTEDDRNLLWFYLKNQSGHWPRRVSLNDAFVQKNLYATQDSSGIQDMSHEYFLAGVEREVAPVICQIIRCTLHGRCPQLPTDKKEKLVRFIYHQHIRAPERRALINRYMNEDWEEDLRIEVEKKFDRPVTQEERAEIEDPKLRQRVGQNITADLAASPMSDSSLQCYLQRAIQFGVIRNEQESFVIGNQTKSHHWFPVHRNVALRLVDPCGPDDEQLTELNDVTEIRRINKETVQDSLAIAGPSERLF